MSDVQTGKLDVRFFKPFIDGTIKALKVQSQIEAKPGKPYFKQREQSNIDIAAVIGLTSAAFTGTITLCFPAAVFLKAMSNMLDEEFTTITQDLQDGAAELLNIIFGQAKIVLNEEGYEIQKAIPTVISGSNLSTVHVSKVPVIVIPFSSSAGAFYIEISIEDNMIK